MAVVGAIVGEFVGAQAGIGVLIQQTEAQMDTSGSFAVFVVLPVIGIVLNYILRRVQQGVLHWMPKDPALMRMVNV